MEWVIRVGPGVPASAQQRVSRLHSPSNSPALPLRANLSKFARVAELADALASGASARKGVGVQVPPRARERNREPVSEKSLAGSFRRVSSKIDLRPEGCN